MIIWHIRKLIQGSLLSDEVEKTMETRVKEWN